MPVLMKLDKKGHYFQWGSRGAKYYFNVDNRKSMERAYYKSTKQGSAIYLHGYRGR